MFAPDDGAFSRVPAATFKELQADGNKLKAVLQYHVSNGFLLNAQISDGMTENTLQGESLVINKQNGVSMIIWVRKKLIIRIIKAQRHCCALLTKEGYIHVDKLAKCFESSKRYCKSGNFREVSHLRSFVKINPREMEKSFFVD